MTPLAASASPTLAALALPGLLLLLAAAAAGSYALLCAISPFGRCKRCEGNGKTRRPGTSPRRGWKTCRRCHGNGARLRIGRRIYHAGTAANQRATKLRNTAAR